MSSARIHRKQSKDNNTNQPPTLLVASSHRITSLEGPTNIDRKGLLPQTECCHGT